MIHRGSELSDCVAAVCCCKNRLSERIVWPAVAIEIVSHDFRAVKIRVSSGAHVEHSAKNRRVPFAILYLPMLYSEEKIIAILETLYFSKVPSGCSGRC